MSGDLISRAALLAAYDKVHQGPPCGARKLIEDAPEALVRCKDCKHYDGDENTIGLGTCLENGVCSTPDWFCADGERLET